VACYCVQNIPVIHPALSPMTPFPSAHLANARNFTSMSSIRLFRFYCRNGEHYRLLVPDLHKTLLANKKCCQMSLFQYRPRGLNETINYWPVCGSTLKIQAICSSETLITTYKTTRLHRVTTEKTTIENFTALKINFRKKFTQIG
jgi:hypothetical protein